MYDGQFRRNVLVVGKTGCRKTYFLQKLGLNNFFGKTVKTEWVSGIEIIKSREAEIQSCFNNEVEFHPAADVEKLKTLIETFKLRTEDLINENDVNINDSIYGEKKWTVLLLWTTCQVWLTHVKNLLIFEQ